MADAVGRHCSLLPDVGGQDWVADTLELVALTLEAAEQPAPAARLLGAARAVSEAYGASPSVRAVRDEIERCQHRVSRTLGPDAFAVEWARGRKMSLERAIVEALEDQLVSIRPRSSAFSPQ